MSAATAETMDIVSPTIVAAAGCATVVMASALAYVMMKSKDRKKEEEEVVGESSGSDSTGETLDATKFPGGYVTVLFGSQTGTAESFVEEIEREGEDNGFKVRVIDLEDLGDNMTSLLAEEYRDSENKSRAIFLMSTYGEGEPTDNASAFVRALKEKAGLDGNIIDDDSAGEEKKGDEDATEVDSNLLGGLEYAVFGLGNRQYEHFNAMGKLVDSALSKVGAERIIELGIGDDDNDLEGDFENWKDNIFWPSLKERYIGGNATAEEKKDSAELKLPDCHFAVEYLPKSDESVEVDNISLDEVQTSTKHYFTSVDCPVTVTRELRSADTGSTLHMEIDISKSKDVINYQTADNLGVLPVNDDKVIEAVANALSYDLDAVFRIKAAPGKEGKHSVPFPTPCTVRECLSRYCDLTIAPRRSDLKQLAAYAKDPLDRSALLRMASKEGKAEYHEKIIDAHVGIGDIVSKLCRSIEAPLEHFIGLCPRLHPRYYTISSSSSQHPDSIHITVSILKEELGSGSVYTGVCSNHLAGIIQNGKIRVFCRDSTFRLPSDTSRPIIMVGPGTGVAPMRALLQERSYQRIQQKLSVGENVLYFGCKNRNQDYIYEDEMESFKNEGTLNTLRIAFSRETEKKVYVQHLLADNAEETWKMVDEQKASVYVCGGVRMGADVTDTLKKIVSNKGQVSLDEAKVYVEKMAKEGRYVQELWA
uniref:NADPH--hemoprotein reductase n=2 Tax=Ditylum brightwellii TaxID=49249 RepID=A0A6V2EWA1_9STRA|mmetsp:Transcript_24015/g.35809  ORF Transcript_24015/g.35809 Transcript_24015/m.35809 type:complete len:705 (+) Transcript_24015:148-2262(+)